MHIVTVLGKPDCHLCHEVDAVIRQVATRRRFRLERLNILEDPSLFEEYQLAIPVVKVNGHEIARHRLTAFALEAALTR
jgi:hypothetical protein